MCSGSANLTSLLVGLCCVSRLARDRQGVILFCLLPFLPLDIRIMLSMSASSSAATASIRPLNRRKLNEVKGEKYEPGALRVIKKDVMKSINSYWPHLYQINSMVGNHNPFFMVKSLLLIQKNL